MTIEERKKVINEHLKRVSHMIAQAELSLGLARKAAQTEEKDLLDFCSYNIDEIQQRLKEARRGVYRILPPDMLKEDNS